MNTYLSSVKLTCIEMSFFLMLCVGVAVAINQVDVIYSLLLGWFASFGYFLLLAYRIYRSADMPPEVAMPYLRAGAGLRMGFVCAMAIIGLKLPGIYIMPFFIGLFAYQIVVRIDNVYTIIKAYLSQTNKRKG